MRTTYISDRTGPVLLGVPCQQTPAGIRAFLTFIAECVDPLPSHIIEYGTWAGGLTLALHERFVNTPIHSYDVLNTPYHPHISSVPGAAPRSAFSCLVVFSSISVLGPPPEIVNFLRAPNFPPKIVVCDGGDKPREVAEAAPLLQPLDGIAAHDWGEAPGADGVEISAQDIPRSLEIVSASDGWVFCRKLPGDGRTPIVHVPTARTKVVVHGGNVHRVEVTSCDRPEEPA